MKKLGLIGGIGPESTIAYYRQLVHGTQERHGAQILPRISIESLSAFQVFAFCREQRFDALARYLLDALESLAAGGAELAALTGNTPNIVLDRIRNRTPLPIVSAIDACREEAKRRKVRTIGLLGTSFTMKNSFFVTPFELSGIRVAAPDDEQVSYIQEKIASELEHGVVRDDTREGFLSIIRDMRDRHGIEQVILGCTELPLILDDANSPVPCLDTTRVHVAALLDAIDGDPASAP